MTTAKRLTGALSADEGADGSPSPDVFADMLIANEDMIAAAAECQTERDVEGVVAYQRILHRNLMEMSAFIDAMFGVYSNANASSSTATKEEQKEEQTSLVTVDMTAEPVDRASAIVAKESAAKAAVETTDRSAKNVTFTVVEAGEKVREIQRSKEKWIRSRHQVLEEEEASAAIESSPKGISEVAASASEEDPESRGRGGLALVNQLRAHQHITAFINSAKESATPVVPATAAAATPLPSHLTVSAAATLLAMPASVPSMPFLASTSQPSNTVLTMLPMLAPAPPLLINPQAVGAFIPLPLTLQTAAATRTMMPLQNYTSAPKSPEFKRMCEECRKRHFSLRRCRLVLQHTDPEWQPAETPTPIRRRRRKQNAAKT